MKLSIDKNFFKYWNPEMSYIVGFIVADGSIIERKGRKESYILNITSKDKKHLFKIRKTLHSNHPVGQKYNSQQKVYYQIQFCDREICKDLMNLGVLPRKTYNLAPIKVPEKYFPAFARGFFDGDGSVYIYNVNKTPQIKAGFVSSSQLFIKEFNKRLCGNLGINTKSVHRTIDKKGKRMIQYNICFYVNDCEKLAEFMYSDSSILYLPRKYRIFEKWNLVKRRSYIKQNYPSKIGWQLNQKLFV